MLFRSLCANRKEGDACVCYYIKCLENQRQQNSINCTTSLPLHLPNYILIKSSKILLSNPNFENFMKEVYELLPNLPRVENVAESDIICDIDDFDDIYDEKFTRKNISEFD